MDRAPCLSNPCELLLGAIATPVAAIYPTSVQATEFDSNVSNQERQEYLFKLRLFAKITQIFHGYPPPWRTILMEVGPVLHVSPAAASFDSRSNDRLR